MSSDNNCVSKKSRGHTGPQGPTGPRGLQGPQGPQGPRGVDGQRGKQGKQGCRGKKGKMGQQGYEGPTGLQGATGIQGPSGATGPTGPTGPDGTQGPTGPQGLLDAIAYIGQHSLSDPSTQNFQANNGASFPQLSGTPTGNLHLLVSNVGAIPLIASVTKVAGRNLYYASFNAGLYLNGIGGDAGVEVRVALRYFKVDAFSSTPNILPNSLAPVVYHSMLTYGGTLDSLGDLHFNAAQSFAIDLTNESVGSTVYIGVYVGYDRHTLSQVLNNNISIRTFALNNQGPAPAHFYIL